MLCIAILLLLFSTVSADFLDIRMPDIRPDKSDLYLCTGVAVKKDLLITAFYPQTMTKHAHHILLYGCANDLSDNTPPWSCGEMSEGEERSVKYASGPICTGSGETIIYAWAMDAPGFKLPQEIAFKIGKASNIHSLVMQVHYKDFSSFKEGETDDSGLKLTVKNSAVPNQKFAGVLLLDAEGTIPPLSVSTLDFTCRYSEDIVLHPFAYRTHAHSLGRAIFAYVIRNEEELLIGEKSPQDPQMFYPVEDKNLEIRKNDTLAGRCEYMNIKNHRVNTGPTRQDEMCNFYIMYWIKSDTLPNMKNCLSNNKDSAEERRQGMNWIKGENVDMDY